MIFFLSVQWGKVFAGGVWTGSEGRVQHRTTVLTQYFLLVGQRLEAPWVCLQQGYGFRSVGTWNTGMMALYLFHLTLKSDSHSFIVLPDT